MSERRLQLQVLLPTEILVDEPATKVIAEAENGAFCLLPRHIEAGTLRRFQRLEQAHESCFF